MLFNLKFSKSLLLLLLLLLLGGGFVASRLGIIDLDLLFCARSSFHYINKELACNSSPVVKKHEYAVLKTKLVNFINSKINEKEVSEVSVYFRDLENGPTLGINEHTAFVPASLLKVPVLLMYLNLAENQPELLEKKLTYHKLKDFPLEQIVLPKEQIKENTPYTIDDLLRRMIVYSDNNAYFVLIQYVAQLHPDENVYGDTLRDLGIINPQGRLLDETITEKSYASIFVQLYNSSFFDKKETSEKALGFLAETDYDEGIIAGIPVGIKVAHKFGERIAGNLNQLHDCGIVYYPKNPYLLCVMTRGKSFETLPGIISAISKMVYEEFNSRRL